MRYSVVVKSEEDESDFDFGEPDIGYSVAPIEVRARTSGPPPGLEMNTDAQHAANVRRYSELYSEMFGNRDRDLEEE